MKFDEGWVKFITEELSKDYFSSLGAEVQTQRNEGKNIAPRDGTVFEALKLTPFANLKAVIVGDHPYTAPDLATGMAYSISSDLPLTPELTNIYKELTTSLGVDAPKNGDLTSWAKAGILLLNSTLTIDMDDPKAPPHSDWAEFTTNCIKYINDKKGDRVVFCLWGHAAQKKAPYIDRSKHLILKAPSPSELTARQGFFGCGHFIHLNKATRIWS